jgi:hypothetical protein
VRVELSSDAAAFVTARGGRLWVWAERPAMCCGGSPAWMRAATTAPSASADAEAGALCLQRPGPSASADAEDGALCLQRPAPSASADAEAGALCLQRPGPGGKSGFTLVPDDAIDLPPTSAPQPRPQLFFRGAGGTSPEVLEIALQGRRRPKVAAYWDGCLMAMV